MVIFKSVAGKNLFAGRLVCPCFIPPPAAQNAMTINATELPEGSESSNLFANFKERIEGLPHDEKTETELLSEMETLVMLGDLPGVNQWLSTERGRAFARKEGHPGETLLMTAILHNQTACALELIPHSDLGVRDGAHRTPLMRAAIRQNADLVEALAGRKEALPEACDSDSHTALHLSIVTGALGAKETDESTRIIARLATACDPDAKDHFGRTALMLVARQGPDWPRALVALLPHSDPGLRDHDKNDALKLAIKAGASVEIIRLLAPVSRLLSRNLDDQTALMTAVNKNNTQLTEALLPFVAGAVTELNNRPSRSDDLPRWTLKEVLTETLDAAWLEERWENADAVVAFAWRRGLSIGDMQQMLDDGGTGNMPQIQAIMESEEIHAELFPQKPPAEHGGMSHNAENESTAGARRPPRAL